MSPRLLPGVLPLLLPVAAVLYTGMTVTSAWRYHRGRGAAWKGRAYGAEPGLLRSGELH